MQLGIGAIQWPWLLRSLRGGTKAQKRALLDHLGLPRDALPNLGSWKADTVLLRRIADRILETKPQLVVEFGAGASSLAVSALIGTSTRPPHTQCRWIGRISWTTGRICSKRSAEK